MHWTDKFGQRIFEKRNRSRQEPGDVADITRRDALNMSASLAIGGSIRWPGVAHAASSTEQNLGASAMNIQRFGISEATADIPIISLATVHDNIVYLCGITADPARLGDVKDQTRQILDRIDRLLSRAGSDKSKLLSAQVWLTDMGLFADHNAVWNAWVDGKNPPVRMCVHSPQLWRPGLLVEIMATAAR
jgi:enamine deaminase RidA (YjgF/YER057c/UK114 family)